MSEAMEIYLALPVVLAIDSGSFTVCPDHVTPSITWKKVMPTMNMDSLIASSKPEEEKSEMTDAGMTPNGNSEANRRKR